VNFPKQIESNCNSIYFYNQGTTVCTIDQLVLTPGMAWAIEGNADEINKTFYNVQFVGNTGQLVITRKIF
jgi:hypothetical protein